MSPFEQLQAKYRYWEFKSRMHYPVSVTLANGNSTQVGERGTLKLKSSEFHQFPDTKSFTFITPTLDDLRDVGLLAGQVKVATASKKVTSPKSTQTVTSE